jgi:hypothetical protein
MEGHVRPGAKLSSELNVIGQWKSYDLTEPANTPTVSLRKPEHHRSRILSRTTDVKIAPRSLASSPPQRLHPF